MSQPEKPKPAEEVFGRKEQATSPQAEVVVDKIDDDVQKVVNPAEQAYSFYTADSAAINAAAAGLANTNAYELAQRAAGDFLSPVRKVLDGLQLLSKVHPFVEVGFIVLKSVVNIELTRRENDRRTIALILQMADMMGALLQLKDVRDPELQTLAGETVVGRLQALMPGIRDDIQQCGETIDAYRKQHIMVKFVKAPMYADKLVSLGKGLADRKTQIVYALNIHTAITVDELNVSVKKMQTQMSLILQNVVNSKSPDELEWDRELERRGGWEKCRSDPLKRDQLFKLFQAKFSGNSGKVAVTVGKPGLGKGKRRKGLNALQDHALNSSMDTLIKENATSYSQKLQQEISQITSAIDGWGVKILSKLDAGPHERIKHAVIKRVWEDSKWRTSVKATHFIRDLKDFYVDLSFKTVVTLQSTPDGNLAPKTPAEGDSDANTLLSSVELQHNPEFDWCLDYLTIFNLPHIMEAFDDDASGWIKISEVNDFTDSIPPTWNLLQWMTYWAAGWHYEISRYRNRIQHILAKMNADQREVLPENNAPILTYLDNRYMGRMTVLVDAAGPENPPGDELVHLVEGHMSDLEAKWTTLLECSNYGIDSMDSLVLLSLRHRVESFVFPLLYVLLRHHYRMIRLGQTVILSEKEFQLASLSISMVMKAVFERRKTLEEEFRQRHLDATEQFNYVAGGIFTGQSVDNSAPPVQYDPKANPRSEEEDDVLAKFPKLRTTDLKFVASALDVSGYEQPWEEPRPDLSRLRPLARFRWAAQTTHKNVRRWSWAVMRRRRDLRREFVLLAIKLEEYLEILNGFEDSPRFEPFTHEEYERFNNIYTDLIFGDVTYYYSLVSLFLRRRQQHLGITCNGCLQRPLTGVRFICIYCDSFDHCVDCETRRTPIIDTNGRQEHVDDHNMIILPWPLPIAEIDRLRLKAKETLESMVHRLAQTEHGNLSSDDLITSPPIRESPDSRKPWKGDNLAGELNGNSHQLDSITCHGGCGKFGISAAQCVCLDCVEEYILCSHCWSISTTVLADKNLDDVPERRTTAQARRIEGTADEGHQHQRKKADHRTHHSWHTFLRVKNLNYAFKKSPLGGEQNGLADFLERFRQDMEDMARGTNTRVDSLREDLMRLSPVHVSSGLTSLDDRITQVDSRILEVEGAVAEMKDSMTDIKDMLSQLLIGLGRSASIAPIRR